METAMVRLVTMVGSGSANQAEVNSLVSEMQQTANETVEMTNRLSSHRGLPKDATDGLRQTLKDMRALNEADDEFTEIQKRL